MTDRYYALDIAAKASGVPIGTIRRWISENKIHTLYTDGRHYVTIQSLLDARDAPRRARSLRHLTR